MKRCSKCGEKKSVFEFYKKSMTKDGLCTQCKICVAKYCKEYYQVHKIECLKRAEKHRQTHKVEDAKYQQKYRRVHKVKATEYNKEYRRAHKNKIAKLQRKYHCTLNGRLRQCFRNLNYRCNDPNDKGYKYYGGRGIKNLFKSFSSFYHHIAADLGLTYDDIKGLQIDRINNNGHYELRNIRFVTAKVNANNRRKRS